MIGYSIKGQVQVYMTQYIQYMIDTIPEPITTTVSTPTRDYLFQIHDSNDGTVILPEEQESCYSQHYFSTFGYLARAWQDIQTPVAFLTIRVKCPDEDGWGKLKRVLKYLHGTKNSKHIIHTMSLDVVQWYVDA